MIHILGISGSLRKESYNTALLEAASLLLPADYKFEVFDGLYEVEPFSEDHEHPQPEGAKYLREKIRAADLLIFSTPEYNSSIPGQLKNAVDWLSRPFGPENAIWAKPTAVISASTSAYGAQWAQDELRKTLKASGARVIETGFSLPQANRAFQGKSLKSQSKTEKLQSVVDALTAQMAFTR